MKKSIRKVVSLVVVLALSLTFLVGCTVDELTLLNALCKQSDINSYETKTEVAFKIAAEGLDASEKESFEQIASLVNGMKIAVNQKATSNKEKTIAKSQSDVKISMDGISTDLSVWYDVDFTGENPKINQIVKVPQILSEFLPVNGESGISNKEYLVMDIGEILTDKSTTGAFYSKELIKYYSSLTPKLIDFIKDYAKEFNPGFSIVTKKGTQTVDNQTVTVYNLKLDDTNFKKLLSYSVTNFVQNERAMEFLKNIALDSVRLSNLPYRERLKTQGEINKAFDQFKTDLPEFLEDWDKVMSVLKDVRILGDKGIDIEFGINKDGYIVSQKGTMEFVIDTNQIINAIEKYESLSDEDYIASYIKDEDNSIIKFEIEFNSSITKINQDIVVDIPEVNTENSVNVSELISNYLKFFNNTDEILDDTSLMNLLQ